MEAAGDSSSSAGGGGRVFGVFLSMKIAIISDTHDNLTNFKKALFWAEKEKIKTVLHCGDIGSVDFLKKAAEDFSGKIHLVLGNMDEYYKIPQEYSGGKNKKVVLHGEIGEIKEGGKKIAFCHFPDWAKKLALSKKYDLVFYGHTHKPWEEKVGDCRLINPGNLAGIFYKSTFAIYDTQSDNLELKILEKL